MMDPNLPNAEAAPETPAETAEDTVAISEDAVVDAFAVERAQLEQDKRDLNERMLRLAAEFDNYRKRTDRERAETIEYASCDAVKALLPILDDFERALQAECADQEYVRGMALIHQRLSETLKKLGLEPIEAEGQPFDPNLHHAIDRIESAEIETDMVASQYQRGYLFKGRLLRAAMVRVAVKA